MADGNPKGEKFTMCALMIPLTYITTSELKLHLNWNGTFWDTPHDCCVLAS